MKIVFVLIAFTHNFLFYKFKKFNLILIINIFNIFNIYIFSEIKILKGNYVFIIFEDKYFLNKNISIIFIQIVKFYLFFNIKYNFFVLLFKKKIII